MKLKMTYEIKYHAISAVLARIAYPINNILRPWSYQPKDLLCYILILYNRIYFHSLYLYNKFMTISIAKLLFWCFFLQDYHLWHNVIIWGLKIVLTPPRKPYIKLPVLDCKLKDWCQVNKYAFKQFCQFVLLTFKTV